MTISDQNDILNPRDLSFIVIEEERQQNILTFLLFLPSRPFLPSHPLSLC